MKVETRHPRVLVTLRYATTDFTYDFTIAQARAFAKELTSAANRLDREVKAI